MRFEGPTEDSEYPSAQSHRLAQALGLAPDAELCHKGVFGAAVLMTCILPSFVTTREYVVVGEEVQVPESKKWLPIQVTPKQSL